MTRPDPALDKHEQLVLDHLDEDKLVRDLATLIRVPSVSGTPAEWEVQEVAAGILADAGAHVDLWDIDLEEITADPWFPGQEVERDRALGLVGTLGGSGDHDPTEPAGLILQGHLDVVPPGDPEAWAGSDPFSTELHGGAIYGRGAADMKAGVAVNLAVAAAVNASGLQLAHPLAVHCVTGEEDGGLGGFATLRRGYRGQSAVITEPTGGRMIIACAGALTFRIEVLGKSAHGSLRREGISAFEAFLPIHRALLALEAERNADPDPLFAGRELPYALSIGRVEAGDWASSVPDRLVAEGRFGVMLDEDPRVARTHFEDVVNQACLDDPWLREQRAFVTWPGGQFASGRLDADHPLIDDVRRCVLDTGGAAPPVRGEVYGSDLRLYAGIGGIPTLHYGPGDPRQAHAPMEHVSIQEVVDVARALVVLAVRRCGVREG
ncbi:acetylornithine deacetylase [Nocardioides massiliensis]|uniref:Acetylornithine deacetylase n=3 Tax=Nocardioides massiliensis TaxID=1325935 RepID=A0ABT9NKE8_9ACTN|nr:ArgE/DapE family deacylase [Nocardioides massiliensis]MDP9820530.1 acetylornithine deacetylase [Nocardioides massiliensis]